MKVNVVDPRKLTDELGEIFVSTLLAVNVSATFIVPRGLYVKYFNLSVIAAEAFELD